MKNQRQKVCNMEENNLPVPGWNAHRHPQDPLRPPSYIFQDVPKAKRDLNGSVLQEIKDRDHFKEAMAEMVLLCTEAIRRTSGTRCSSKPLSLEYIADRLDVDDPCFGYMVRSSSSSSSSSKEKEEAGMLQGFVTVTTFTNWQKNFRWDSQHELAFYYDDDSDDSDDDDDDDDVRHHQPKKERKVDRDGSLAQELSQTVRLGDPYNEGIVWPRIAEISLLGALGCGRALVQLVIEQLEFQKATARANYDFIALQATDNSIPFYESLGFVRVGGVTVDDHPNSIHHQPRSDSPDNSTSSTSSTSTEGSASVAAVPLEPCSPEKPDALALPSADIVTSPLSIHEVQKAGETVSEVARKHKVNVWDIIFLNCDLYKDMQPSSRLMKGTMLHIPAPEEESTNQSDQDSPTKWFVAKENDTPRKIAKTFSIPCKALVEANRKRLPELQASSRLKEGTRIKVSNLEQHDDVCSPYCHWSFPDDTGVDGGERSYMMVRRIERKTARCPRSIRQSLAVPISPYTPPQLLLPFEKPKETIITTTIKGGKRPPAPKCPPEPPTAFDIFQNQQREFDPELATKNPKSTKILEKRWMNLGDDKQERYKNVANETRKHYDRAYEEYEVELSLWEDECARIQPKTIVEKEASLFNKVVKLKEDALEGKKYSYW